jgi:hypothetical protein
MYWHYLEILPSRSLSPPCRPYPLQPRPNSDVRKLRLQFRASSASPETRAFLKLDQDKVIVFIAIATFQDIGMQMKPGTSQVPKSQLRFQAFETL